jgi:hypothetical protein
VNSVYSYFSIPSVCKDTVFWSRSWSIESMLKLLTRWLALIPLLIPDKLVDFWEKLGLCSSVSFFLLIRFWPLPVKPSLLLMFLIVRCW